MVLVWYDDEKNLYENPLSKIFIPLHITNNNVYFAYLGFINMKPNYSSQKKERKNHNFGIIFELLKFENELADFSKLFKSWRAILFTLLFTKNCCGNKNIWTQCIVKQNVHSKVSFLFALFLYDIISMLWILSQYLESFLSTIFPSITSFYIPALPAFAIYRYTRCKGDIHFLLLYNIISSLFYSC